MFELILKWWILPSLISALLFFAMVRLNGHTLEELDEDDFIPGMFLTVIWPLNFALWAFITIGFFFVEGAPFLFEERQFKKESGPNSPDDGEKVTCDNGT